MKKLNLIEIAKETAIAAHDSINHRRKYTDEPYWVHPERVAKILQRVTNKKEVIAAAWLHDVLEDVAPINNKYSADNLRDIVGKNVIDLVLEVTDISKPSDGNRATRKAIDNEHLKKASPEGKLIKIADLVDNLLDIKKHDKHFYRVFKNEALVSLDILKDAHEELYREALKILTPSPR